MDRMLYVAMSGARETMLAQGVNAHNLANISTTGFRKDLESFMSLQVRGPVFESRAYALEQGQGVDFTPGPIQQTGRDLDVAIQGDGFIAVQAPDGTEAYTRAGDLRVSSAGILTNGAGHPVLGEGGPVAIPEYETLTIGADGTISVRGLGQPSNALAVVDRIKLVNPPLEELQKGEDGLLRMADGQPFPPDAQVQLVGGAIEGSNVNGVDAMVDMIQLARQYELQVKMMKTAEQIDESASQLIRFG
ncbi:MAG: flagellar basal-body rod protein FlgF [Gammaproteobacteria bacterium]|nr:flagellar basal-body rod protein FlgF [Gammaproteobacteria bacterium]MDX5375429.1 flagellar basal-body rod protein FlgF [Gammaproteobacteria bacterium]